jgi:hypothetical protein
MKKQWLKFVLGLCLAVLVMIMSHRYVGEAILITLLCCLWVAKLIIFSVPRFVPWLLFLIGAFFMAVHYIRRLGIEGKTHHAVLPDSTGLVSFWAKRLQMTVPGHYYQQDIARLLGRLTIGMLGLQEYRNSKTPAAQLVSEAPNIPTDIKDYLLAGLQTGKAGIPKLGRIRRVLMRLGLKRTGPLDPEKVVAFIEASSE